MKRLDLVGKRFGTRVVKEFSHADDGNSHWLVECDCGDIAVTGVPSLHGGSKCRSCADKDRWKSRPHHGGSASREFNIWSHMKHRCLNSNSPAWKWYGGRGIKVCERWLKFENFIADMGASPSNKHSIDRVSNSGNYEPGNCRWATTKEQRRNTRHTRFVTIGGITRCIKEWSEVSGVPFSTVLSRKYAGWPDDELLLHIDGRTNKRPSRSSRPDPLDKSS